MNPDKCTAGAQALLEIQAECRRWGEVLHRNGWDSDKMAAANTPEAKAAEMATMGLIKKHEALLTHCRYNFVRDPSTPLDRALGYIGVYLGRGAEALTHTVGLPECLTVEVAQPNVAEPYREPTFIVQLGRWAQKVSEEQESGGGKTGKEGTEEINDTPVTLREFMAMFCQPLTENLREYRVKSLQNAARRGAINLPKHVGHWESGQSKKYSPIALVQAWPSCRKRLPTLPRLKPEFGPS